MCADATTSQARTNLGGWQADPLNRALVHTGLGAIAVEPRLLSLFEAFAVKPGQTLTKDELIAATWGHQHVADNSLNKAISDLRQVLAADPQRGVRIQTVHRVGYRSVVDDRGPGAHGVAAAADGNGDGPAALRRSHWIAACWLLVAGLSMLDFWAWQPEQFDLWRALAQHAIIFLPWIAIGYGLGRLAPLLPAFGPAATMGNRCFHALASLMLMLMHSALHAASFWVALSAEQLANASVLGAWGECLTRWGALEVVAYWAILRIHSPSQG